MSSTPTSPAKPLAPRDINTSSPTKPTTKPVSPLKKSEGGLDKPKSMDYHRQVLQNRLAEEQGKQVYVSPSDAVLSPCTQKLSAYKGKSFMKAKPQSLFAKMGGVKKTGVEGLGEKVGGEGEKGVEGA